MGKHPMKMKYENIDLVIATWRAGVENLLFPPDVVDELDPAAKLDGWGDELPVIREEYRDKVDAFIDSVFELETPPSLWSLLRKTDPMLVAFYYDRILAATFSLEQVKQTMPVVQVPESWETLSRLLLFQKLFQ